MLLNERSRLYWVKTSRSYTILRGFVWTDLVRPEDSSNGHLYLRLSFVCLNKNRKVIKWRNTELSSLVLYLYTRCQYNISARLYQRYWIYFLNYLLGRICVSFTIVFYLNHLMDFKVKQIWQRSRNNTRVFTIKLIK